MPSCEPVLRTAPKPWLNIAPAVLILCLILAGCGRPRDIPDDQAIAVLGSASPLLPLYKGLYGLETGTRTTPVVILQIGDSHTANDSFSSRLRQQFQYHFGDDGRGVLPPGVPYNYYRPDRVAADSPGWTVYRAGRSPGPVGITGFRQHTDGPAQMTLYSATPLDETNVTLEFLGQPGGGSVDIAGAAGWRTRVSTNAATTGPQWVALPKGAGGGKVTIDATGDGPVDMLSWSADQDRPGVTVSNLGTIGATVDLLLAMDPALVRQELARLKPTAILVAFGTNEGYGAGTEAASYHARYEQALELLRGAAPSAAIVILGPPDSQKATARHFKGQTRCGDPRWGDPPRVDLVRDVQRQIAAEDHLVFWDWQAAMGGACSIGRWAAMSPPMAGRDHVHLLQPGYQATADGLFGMLMDGYRKYKSLGPGS